MCTRHFGSVVTQTIRTYKTDQFPLLLIVMGKRTSNEVLNVIQGEHDDVIVIFFEGALIRETIRVNWTFSRQYDSRRADDEVNGSDGDFHSTTTGGHQRRGEICLPLMCTQRIEYNHYH